MFFYMLSALRENRQRTENSENWPPFFSSALADHAFAPWQFTGACGASLHRKQKRVRHATQPTVRRRFEWATEAPHPGAGHQAN